MIRSIIICALILIVATLLGWREKQKLSRNEEANAKLVTEAAAIPYDNAETPRAAAIPNNRMERRKEDLAMKAKVKTLTSDFFEQSRKAAEDPAAAFGEEFRMLEANLKSRLGELDPAGIKQFIEECKNNPDLNSQIKQDLNRYIREVFIQKDPIEMTRMMVKSPELFGIGDEKTYDPFQYLVYYYSYMKKDIQLVFQCLAESPPAFQSKYIGGALQFHADSPSQRAELLEEMRYFATTPELKELVNGQLSDLAFGRPDVKGSFIELTDWLGSANLSSEELVAATKGMQDKVRVGETALWLDWLAKSDVPEEVSKERAFDLATRWTEKDYQAVGNWLNSTPDSPEKAAVASAYAAKTYPYDPENAMKWIQTLPQGPDRTKALQTIYQGLQNNENLDYDTEVVEAFAREHGLKE